LTKLTAKTILAIKFGVLAVATLVYFYLPGLREFIFTSLSYLHNHNFEQVRYFILAYGVWAPLISIALMVIQSLVPFVPGMAVTIANAWIFGWHLGAVYSWIGALLGAVLDFGIARWYGRPAVERLVNCTSLDKTDAFLERHGVFAVFITRLMPVVPFKLISYGAGLSIMSFWQYTWATAVGQTPAIILYSILGQYITTSLRLLVAITTSLMLLAALVYYYRKEIKLWLFFRKKRE